MSHSLHVRIVESLDEFRTLAGVWNHLVGAAESASVFLRWEWLYHWTAHYLGPNRLWILLVLDDRQRVLGIAPFYLRSTPRSSFGRLREVAFLGTEEVCSAYLDIIAATPFKRHVLDRLYRFLMEEAADEWDVMTLEAMSAESSTVGKIMAAFEEAGKVVELAQATWCPVVKLPRSWMEYRRSLSANARYNLQRKQKALERLGAVSYRDIRKGPEVSETFQTFMTLHGMRWGLRGTAGGAFRHPRFARFHRDIVTIFEAQGWLDLSLLMLDDRPIAGLYGFVVEGTYYLYLPGLDPTVASQASPGMLLLARRIQQAIGEGQGMVDLLRGDAAYKMTWATDRRCCLTLRGYNRSGHAGYLKLLDGVKQAVKIIWR